MKSLEERAKEYGELRQKKIEKETVVSERSKRRSKEEGDI